MMTLTFPFFRGTVVHRTASKLNVPQPCNGMHVNSLADAPVKNI